VSKSKTILGNRIRYLRKKRGLSQEKLAELLEISPNSVSRIECGVHYPSLDTLENISIILGVEMLEFFKFRRIETVMDKRAFLIQAACELGDAKLDELVRAVRKIA
jgi:transcriptional regulator with XRE-family HTH domain